MRRRECIRSAGSRRFRHSSDWNRSSNCPIRFPQRLDSPLGGRTQQSLELAEGVLDRGEVGTCTGGRYNNSQPTPSIARRAPASVWLPRLSITTTSPRRNSGTNACSTYARNNSPLIPLRRSPRCDEPADSQRPYKGSRLPVPVRVIGQALTHRRVPVGSGHVGLGPRLVNEHQFSHVESGRGFGPPVLPLLGHVRPTLLGGVDHFFCA